MNEVYRALSDPTRRRILALLRQGDLSAGDIAANFGQAWPTISGHLAVLRDANLVHADRRGTSINYHLNVSVLEEAMLALMQAFGIGTATSASEGKDA
jgi:ArsR family transcriptional regulator, arsenate/arsenite/antimonite-responsive transcriptional repressor